MRNVVGLPWPLRGAVPLIFLLASCIAVFAAKEFVKPEARNARAYPAHDEHVQERVTAAIDPYDFADKTDKVFNVHWNDEGYLPIFLVIQNDGDQPISLANMQAEFVTAHRAKIVPATNDDLYRRLSHVSASGTSPLPLPIPKKPKGGVSKKAQEEINRAQFDAKAVEPHSTQSGFLFFDVSGISTPLPGAHVYLTGVRDSKGNELMYFEIPLEKYLAAPAEGH
jgi:hypothetical protein